MWGCKLTACLPRAGENGSRFAVVEGTIPLEGLPEMLNPDLYFTENISGFSLFFLVISIQGKLVGAQK